MVTVADVLADPPLGLRAVDLPRPEAEVRWVAVSELPDPAPFLEGGEVLLTTGLETARWAAEWQPYVDRLAAAGVSALGLAVGLTHDRAPAALTAACRARALNLFEVPRATTFVAVSRAVVRLLEAAEQAATRAALDSQRRLIQAALQAEDTRAILGRLAEAGEGAACTVTADGRIDEGPVGPARGLLDLDRARDEVVRLRPSGLRAASSTGVAGGTMVVQPVGLAPRPTRYVVAGFPGRLADPQRLAMTTAVALLSLADERRRAGRDTDRALRARAVELLLQGEGRGAGLLLGARPGAAPARLPDRAVLVRVTGPVDALHDALTELEETAVLGAVLDEELVCVASPSEVPQVVAVLVGEDVRVGVGEQVPLAELHRSHVTAGFALGSTGAGNPVASWEAAVDRGVLSLVDDERAEAFAESLLGALAGPAGDDLLTTLATFLRHHGSHVRVAAELGVHRNTVRHRLDAVQRALGRSLDDPQTRVDCWVALQVRTGRT